MQTVAEVMRTAGRGYRRWMLLSALGPSILALVVSADSGLGAAVAPILFFGFCFTLPAWIYSVSNLKTLRGLCRHGVVVAGTVLESTRNRQPGKVKVQFEVDEMTMRADVWTSEFPEASPGDVVAVMVRPDRPRLVAVKLPGEGHLIARVSA